MDALKASKSSLWCSWPFSENETIRIVLKAIKPMLNIGSEALSTVQLSKTTLLFLKVYFALVDKRDMDNGTVVIHKSF